eukprot:TRINITY_DN74305_c0_g1_i1.p1 TRINITY_DN74305_c0_g1~~TRINITY_DN74305_c0_g1_i1.p1  ORF type:complete len:418 (-),score=72.44 TRINITY_DN74305_c0_g1_i1:205-1458(-)
MKAPQGGPHGYAKEPSQQSAEFTPEGWYGPHVGPDASVKEYSMATPRGMTNPPQSRRVKSTLYKELHEYGVDFAHESWPPPNPLRQTPKHSLLVSKQPEARNNNIRYPQNALLTLEEQRAAMPIFIGSSPADITSKYLAIIKAKSGKSPKLPASPSLPVIQLQAPTGGGERQTSVASAGARTAISLDEPRQRSKARALTYPAHDRGPKSKERKTWHGNSLLTPGGGSGDFGKKGDSRSRSKSVSSEGRRSAVANGSGAGSRHGDKGNGAGKNGQGAGDENPEKGARVATEYELHNKVEALRSASRLHRAGAADIHKFCADVSTPGSMVLGNPDSSGCWSSDAAELTRFHNGAMRMVDPSKLEVLPMPTRGRKKKKGDEENQALSETGKFFARYPRDPALRVVKTLCRQMVPKDAKGA